MLNKKNKKQPPLIFIAEDNKMYAKTLMLFLQSEFPSATVEVFPVGELLIDNLHREPDVVIMDYFLNTKYHDASNGLEMTKEVRAKNPKVQVIILSSQQDLSIAKDILKEVDMNYIEKDEDAFNSVAGIIRKVIG
jgi:DNA-binding NarL/FixJ family response regulator